MSIHGHMLFCFLCRMYQDGHYYKWSGFYSILNFLVDSLSWKGIFEFLEGNLWAFQPILVTSFLVVFSDEVTKILHNSLFIFHFVGPILPCKRKKSYRKSRHLSNKKPKMKLPKYVMSQAINAIFCLNWCFYREN